MTLTTLRPLSIGEILDGAFTLYRRHFTVLSGTALTFFAPLIVVVFVEPELQKLVGIPCGVLAGIASVWQMSEGALGRKPSFLGGLKIAFRCFLRVLLAGFVTGFIVLGGALLLIVPGVILLVRFFAVTQVVVLEGRQDYLRRSSELTKNAWGKVFVVYLISTLITFVPGLALGFATSLFDVNAYRQNHMPEYGWIAQELEALVQSLTIPFGCGVMTLLYYDLRVRKEGLDVSVAAEALDEEAWTGDIALPPGAS